MKYKVSSDRITRVKLYESQRALNIQRVLFCIGVVAVIMFYAYIEGTYGVGRLGC